LKRAELHISNKLGLHARAAARFVHVANRFRCQIIVSKDHSRVDGKSILGVTADGEDAEQALAALDALVREGFGEVD